MEHPTFCPKCGKKKTIKITDSVWFEQGESNGKEYENEGMGTVYTCSNCKYEMATLDQEW